MPAQRKAKQMKASSFVPGRMYSMVYESDVDMVGKREIVDSTTLDSILEFKRDGKFVLNPLADCSVTVRRVFSIQAAGNKTYRNMKLKQDPTWQPSTEHKAWWNVTADNSCICEHRTEGTRYLRALPRGITKEEYFIGERLVTKDSEIATIKAFRKSKGETNFIMMKLDNLTNVTDDGGEAE
jgi:hypothetical protein